MTCGTLGWRIADRSNPDTVYSEGESDIAGTVLTEGEDGWYCTLAIDDQIPSGLSLAFVTFDGGDGLVYSSADIVRALPGLSASGTLSLDIPLEFETGFTVTDGVGDEIGIGIASDGESGYSTGSESITVALDRALEENESVLWFLSGELIDATIADAGYTISPIPEGRSYLTAVVWDTEKASAIGSVTILLESYENGTKEVRTKSWT